MTLTTLLTEATNSQLYEQIMSEQHRPTRALMYGNAKYKHILRNAPLISSALLTYPLYKMSKT